MRGRLLEFPDGIRHALSPEWFGEAKVRTDVGPVNEAKQVQQRHGGHDHEIDLEAQAALGLLVEDDERVAIPGVRKLRSALDAFP